MRVFHAGDALPDEITLSVFLMGPTLRSSAGPPAPSWRSEALATLKRLNFDGEIFVPECQGGEWPENYAA